MSFEQEKMIVGSLPSLYPLQKFEEEAINALVSLPIDDDTISRAKAIEALDKRFDSIPMEQTSEILMLRKDLRELPPAQQPMPSNTSNALEALDSVNATQYNALGEQTKWNRMMLHLADLQLTYSPDWGANGQGDQKLYDFVTGLIEEFEGWDEGSNAELQEAVDRIKKLPSALPEHIIHCKDCKYFKQVFAPNDNDGLCGHWHSKCDARTSREGYCSHAERKQNDTERC